MKELWYPNYVNDYSFECICFLDGWLDAWMDAWMMDAWMDGCLDDGCMHGCMCMKCNMEE